MKHLFSYNESLRDKMTGKELSDEDKYAVECFEKILEVGDKMTPVKKINNVYYSLSYLYGILVTYCDPKNYKGDEQIGYQQDHIVKIKKDWTVYININGINRNYENNDYITNSDNFDVILKKIIDICHNDIDGRIDDIKKEIKEKENKLNYLEHIKNLKETL